MMITTIGNFIEVPKEFKMKITISFIKLIYEHTFQKLKLKESKGNLNGYVLYVIFF